MPRRTQGTPLVLPVGWTSSASVEVKSIVLMLGADGDYNQAGQDVRQGEQ